MCSSIDTFAPGQRACDTSNNTSADCSQRAPAEAAALKLDLFHLKRPDSSRDTDFQGDLAQTATQTYKCSTAEIYKYLGGDEVCIHLLERD